MYWEDYNILCVVVLQYDFPWKGNGFAYNEKLPHISMREFSHEGEG